MKKFFGFLLVWAILSHPAFLWAEDNPLAVPVEAAEKAVAEAPVKADSIVDDLDLGQDEDALTIVDETDEVDQTPVVDEAEALEDTLDDLDEK